jgi:eukaryotic-like serine/threonine-protein kinase
VSGRESNTKSGGCPQCGVAISATTTLGLCPRCLLLTLAEEDDSSGDEALPVFGDYELLEKIASGGMGTVFRACQRSLDRIVALKVITAGALASRDMVERFRNEASAAASLSHPYIVPIYEVGEHEGQQFFSMEFIDGPRLDRLHKQQPLSLRGAAGLLIKLAQAVNFAHQRSILHRDIKPGNILVDAQGEPHLTDFGLAKVLERESTITHTMALLGTPSYMSPEQARGETKQLTTAVDIYGLGAVLYELLTGAPPFAGGTTLETVRHVLDTEPRRPSTLNPSVDRDLETICLKCLEKEPGKRYGSALAFGEDLQRWLRHEPILARPLSVIQRGAKWVRRRPLLAGVTALLGLVAIVGFTATFWQWQRAEQQTISARRAQVEAERLVDRLDLERADIRFLSGERAEALALLAGVLRRQPTNHIAAERLISFLSLNSFLLPIFEGFPHPEFDDLFPSPDGTRLLTGSTDGLVRLWEIATGRLERTIQHHAPTTNPAWSPDGRFIASGFYDRTARVWDTLTGEEISPALSHLHAPSVLFSRDGTRLITWSWLEQWVRIWNWKTGELLRDITGLKPVRGLRASPSSDHFLMAYQDELQMRDFDGTLVASVATNNLPNVGAWSPNGRVAATTTGVRGVVFYESSTMKPLPFQITERVPEGRPTFSADGLWLMMGERFRVGELRDLRTGRPLNVPLLHRDSGRLAWLLADGTRALTSGDGDPSARVCDARPGAMISPPLRHEGRITSASFSLDGSRVLTTSTDKTARIWDAVSGEPITAPLKHTQSVERACFSPDAGRVATITGDHSLRVWNGRDGTLITDALRHRSSIQHAMFSSDGNAVLTAAGETAVLWELSTPPREKSFAHEAPVWSIAVGPGHFATGTGPAPSELIRTSGRIRIWKVGGETPVASIETTGGVMALAFSRDGDFLAVGLRDGSVGVWSLKTGKWLANSVRHDAAVTSVRFSPDGHWLISSGYDDVVRVLDARTGASRYAPLRHAERPNHAEFSGDGQRIVTMTLGGIPQLWDAETGLPLTSPIDNIPAPVSRWQAGPGSTVISPDGERILSVSSDFSARVLNIPSVREPAPPWLAELAEAIGGYGLAKDRQQVEIRWSDYLKVRERLARQTGEDFYSRWVRWFLADRSTRTISPYSSMRVQDYAARLIRENTAESIWEVVRFQPTNAVVLARLGARLSDETGPGLFQFSRSGEFLIQRALSLAPDNAEVRRIAELRTLAEAE